MFAKIFEQIFDSSISEDYIVRHVFMDLLVLCDREGVVDMTIPAVTRRTNVPQELVEHAITRLCESDTESRSHLEDGKRLVLLDSHREWGWQIVNYAHYRGIVDEESRRAYFRDKARKYRASRSNPSKTASDNSNLLKEITQAEADGEAENQTPSPHSANEPRKASSPDARLNKADLSVLAAEIYGEYPRKVGRQDAIKGIEKSIVTISKRAATEHHEAFNGDINLAADWLKSRAALYANSPQGKRKDKEHIPHPATWFNGARYDDDDSEWTHVGPKGRNRSLAVDRALGPSPSEGFEDVLSRPEPVWMKARTQ